MKKVYTYAKWVPKTKLGKFIDSLLVSDVGTYTLYRSGKKIYVLRGWQETYIRNLVDILNAEANIEI